MEKIIKVLVVNGSPKGEHSLTLQHSLYMLGQEKGTEFRVLQAGEALSPMTVPEGWLDGAMADVAWADAILWTTPVYTMLVPWQLLRLVQLIREAGKGEIFQGKYATSMMTCFHYYDHLAEDWLRGTSEDLGMQYMEGRTADNEDMLKKEHRASMRHFFHAFISACREKAPLERKFMPLPVTPSPRFTPSGTGAGKAKRTPGGRVLKTVLLTDEVGEEGNLSRMIQVFLEAYPHPVEIVDIRQFPYVEGCVGCLKCELVGECRHEDGFQDFYLNLVETCDVLLFAMNLEERYLKPIWKLFLDRTFANGHRTSMMGKHTAYLVAGPLRSLPGVRQFLEGKDNVGHENSMGIIGDEYEDSAYLVALLRNTAGRLSQAAEEGYQKSVNFLGVGGMKIFRDLIYGMRGVVRDDHRFYKARGLYDFPQRNLKKQLFNIFMGLFFAFRPVRLQAYEAMPELYIEKHKELVRSGQE